MTIDHDQLLDPDLLADLAARPIEEVRAQRDACVEAETGLSYLRRLVQGAIDIGNRELARRAGGGDPRAVEDLVGELPEILGEGPRGAGVGRLPQGLAPTQLDAALVAEYEALVPGARLAEIAELDAVELADLLDRLGALEQRVAELRSAYFARIDALQAELTRRYRTGEASVDTLLRDAGA